MSKDAVRARARRAAAKQQVALPFGDAGRDRGRPVATAVATDVRDRSGNPVRHAACSPDPPEPEDLKTQVGGSSRDRPTAVATVRHDPERPPAWAFDDASRLRPDLAEFIVRGMWVRFATKTAHRTTDDARDHFARWLERENGRGPRIATTWPQNASARAASPADWDEPEEPVAVHRGPPAGLGELFAPPRPVVSDRDGVLTLDQKRQLDRLRLQQRFESEARSMSA